MHQPSATLQKMKGAQEEEKFPISLAKRIQFNLYAGIINSSAEGCFKANHHGQIALLFPEQIQIKSMLKVKQSQVDSGEQ